MACVEVLQQVESIAAPDFTQNYPIRAAPESYFQKFWKNCWWRCLIPTHEVK
jgi:hypothetical protein